MFIRMWYTADVSVDEIARVDEQQRISFIQQVNAKVGNVINFISITNVTNGIWEW